MTNSKMLKQ